VLDVGTVERLQRHWEQGWNAYDLETIMAPMADHVVFSSPFVARMTGDPARTTIEGVDALRSYIADSLRRVRGISYVLDGTFVGTETVILAYGIGLPDGTRRSGADSMRVDADNQVVEWRCHYRFAPAELDQFISG
jgi:hypothetical protein